MNEEKILQKRSSLFDISYTNFSNNSNAKLPEFFEKLTEKRYICSYEKNDGSLFIIGKDLKNNYSIYKYKEPKYQINLTGQTFTTKGFTEIPVQYPSFYAAEKGLEKYNNYKIKSTFHDLNNKEQTLILMDVMNNETFINSNDIFTARNFILENEQLLTFDYIKKTKEAAPNMLKNQLVNLYSSILHNTEKLENDISNNNELSEVFNVLNSKKTNQTYETEISLSSNNLNYFINHLKVDDISQNTIKLGIRTIPEESHGNRIKYQTYLKYDNQETEINNNDYLLNELIKNDAINKGFLNKNNYHTNISSYELEQSKSTKRQQEKEFNDFEYMVRKTHSFVETYFDILSKKNTALKDFVKIVSGLTENQKNELMKDLSNKAENLRRQNFDDFKNLGKGLPNSMSGLKPISGKGGRR